MALKIEQWAKGGKGVVNLSAPVLPCRSAFRHVIQRMPRVAYGRLTGVTTKDKESKVRQIVGLLQLGFWGEEKEGRPAMKRVKGRLSLLLPPPLATRSVTFGVVVAVAPSPSGRSSG